MNRIILLFSIFDQLSAFESRGWLRCSRRSGMLLVMRPQPEDFDVNKYLDSWRPLSNRFRQLSVVWKKICLPHHDWIILNKIVNTITRYRSSKIPHKIARLWVVKRAAVSPSHLLFSTLHRYLAICYLKLIIKKSECTILTSATLTVRPMTRKTSVFNIILWLQSIDGFTTTSEVVLLTTYHTYQSSVMISQQKSTLLVLCIPWSSLFSTTKEPIFIE